MIGILKSRLKQGYRTMAYPDGPAPEMPSRFVGRPILKSGACPEACHACKDVCPTDAIAIKNGVPSLDLGRCLFCRECQRVCPSGTIDFSRDFQLAGAKRDSLHVCQGDAAPNLDMPDQAIKSLFGRSLKLRQVSAGGCNACEADTNVLGTVAWDLGRFGIQFVASPRHADGILVTGPVTAHMKGALQKAYAAIPAPKLVIAVGACAISGGIFESHEETHQGLADILPVDLFIPGCPPHPATILDGMLRLIGRIAQPNS